MAKGYLPDCLDQRLLLPPDMRAWLPEGHLALFVLDVVSALDLSAIHAVYEARDDRGRAGFDPRMMVALLVYAYCVGKPSSRKIERATYEDVAFRVLSGDQHPDHDCVAAFRNDLSASAADRMRHKLATAEGRALYKMRKAIVEPVFGQIKSVRGFCRFALRGLANASAEWKLIALTHNLLKLFRRAPRSIPRFAT